MFMIILGFMFALAMLIFVMTVTSRTESLPKNMTLSTVIDESFNPDAEDLLDYLRHQLYINEIIPKTPEEMVSVVYSYLEDWAREHIQYPDSPPDWVEEAF